MTNQEMYRQLRALGFSAEQALAEMDGSSDDSYDNAVARRAARPIIDGENGLSPTHSTKRNIRVAVPAVTNRRRVARGPRMEYVIRPIPKGRKVTVSMGNNTDVYKYLSSLRGKAATVPMIAEATGISPHSVESSVYRLVTDKLIAKQPIEAR
jgi:hypothetical protein